MCCFLNHLILTNFCSKSSCCCRCCYIVWMNFTLFYIIGEIGDRIKRKSYNPSQVYTLSVIPWLIPKLCVVCIVLLYDFRKRKRFFTVTLFPPGGLNSVITVSNVCMYSICFFLHFFKGYSLRGKKGFEYICKRMRLYTTSITMKCCVEGRSLFSLFQPTYVLDNNGYET